MSRAEAKYALFPLHLQSKGNPGAPTDDLRLLIDPFRNEVTGSSVVTQATNPVLRLASHVTGELIYQTVTGPGSTIRIDLTGWPEIKWPPHAGLGPVIPENYKAILVLDTNYTSGVIRYVYRTDLTGPWHAVEQQVHIVKAA